MLAQAYLRGTHLAERTFEYTVFATEDLWDSSQRRATPHAVCSNKNYEQFTSETS